MTVALALMAHGTAAVLVSLPLGSYLLLSLSALLALLCGWGATRIVHTEVVQTRREAARQRAAQARAFQALFATRSTEHSQFAAAMTDRLTAREREIRELEGTLRLSERRATHAEDRARREARRANQAQERVAELEEALAVRRAEEADELAVWAASPGSEFDTVVDLLAWEDRSQTERRDRPELRRHA